MNSRKSTPKAFTLVELLVVIGIIAGLIAILLPTLSRARASAQAVVCQSHLHTLGISLYSYLVDNKGRADFGLFVLTSPTTGYDINYWFGNLDLNGYDYTKGYLTRYYRDPRVLDCPTLDGEINYAVFSSTTPRISYAYNGQASGISNFSAIRLPVNTMALMDASQISTQFGGFSTTFVSYQPAQTSLISNNFHGRHNTRGNVLWYDGHVTAEKPYVVKSPASYVANNSPYINQYIANNIGYLTPCTPSTTSEANLIASTSPDVAYYYWLDKSARN